MTVIEEPVEAGGDVLVAGFALDASDDFAGGVEDEGGGKSVAEVEAVEGVEVRAEPDVEGDVVLVEEGFDLRAVFGLVGGDRDEVDAALAILLVELDEAGKLVEAGCAPGCPEADDGDGATQGAEALRMSGEVGELEVGDGFGCGG